MGGKSKFSKTACKTLPAVAAQTKKAGSEMEPAVHREEVGGV
jgi:hypothetical protein